MSQQTVFIPLKRNDVTFACIKELIGRSLATHEWPVEGGGTVEARVKITTRKGLIVTSYLHVVITKASGYWERWREQSDGQYRCMSYGHRKGQLRL